MRIKFADNNDEVLSNANIRIDVNKNSEIYLADNEGYIDIEKLKSGIKLVCHIYPGHKQLIVCRTKESMTVKFRLQEQGMVFVTFDKNNQPVGNTNAYFEYSGEFFEKKSDEDAYIL
jgi:hypothetical protein